MFKFFRHIRQQLLAQHRFSKYMLYAVGEIVLVVIGILIALQVNNWNEYRKLSNKETDLYVKLLSDIKSSYKGTLNNINNAKWYQDVNYQVYNESKGKAIHDSTLNYDVLQWVMVYKLKITDKYTEQLNTITNDKIRAKLKYYISAEKSVKEAFDEWNKFKEEQLRPFFTKYGIHNTDAAYNNRPYVFNSLMSIDMLDHSELAKYYGTLEFEELLFDLRFKTSWMFHNLQFLEEANRYLRKTLKEELSLNNDIDFSELFHPVKLYELFTEGKTIDEIISIVKDNSKKESIYDISENEISRFGYLLLDKEKFNDAQKIFKLNTELFPESYNAFGSYGECLLMSGDIANGIDAYKKSKELNPKNQIPGRFLANTEIMVGYR